MAHPGLSLICDRCALYFHPGIIKNRHMNNMRYGHYFTSKKNTSLETTFIYVESMGNSMVLLPELYEGYFYERPKKNLKKR